MIDDTVSLPPLVRTDALTFAYADQTLFERINLQLSPGKALVLVGANGSGKSTLLRLLAGLLSPDEGRIERADDADGNAIRIAWLGHLLGLKLELSVIENLRFLLGMHGSSGRVTMGQALASVDLADFEPVRVRELSAGQRKRIALARLLLSPAPVWLLDEPYANLDPEGCKLVDRLVDRHLRTGGTAALSVHRIDQVGFDGDKQLFALTEPQ